MWLNCATKLIRATELTWPVLPLGYGKATSPLDAENSFF
jgi:hypothetical protein